MTLATIANRLIKMGDAASPEVFTAIEEVLSISGFGEASELVETTNLDSAGTREYIAGLTDGQEFTVECNHVDGATIQEQMKAAQAATRNFQYARTDSSPSTTATFAGVILGWEEAPNVSEQNRITFTVKITGAIS